MQYSWACRGPMTRSFVASPSRKRANSRTVSFEEIGSLKLSFIAYSNPGNFMRIAAKLLPWLWGSTAFAFALGLFGTFAAPADYQQGETARIMYIHVPAAWTAMLAYTFMAVSALGSLVWRHPLRSEERRVGKGVDLGGR